MKKERMRHRNRRRLILAGLVVAGWVLITMQKDADHPEKVVKAGAKELVVPGEGMRKRAE